MISAYYLPKDSKDALALTEIGPILEMYRQKQGLLWVDIESPTAEEANLLAEGFAFHPVAVQACREVNSQPLVHSYDGYLFMVIHAVNIQPKGPLVDTQEIDIFWGKHFVLTYHQAPVKSLTEMCDTCTKDCPFLMARGTDFFIHAVVDRIIDNFTPTLDRIEYLIEEIDIQIFRRPTDALLQRLLDLKQTVMYLTRIATAQRDVVGRIIRGEPAPITKQAMAYWHEAYDHLVRMAQTTEAQRELITTSRDMYMSVVSNRLNAIMKVLTIIMTVFMPLSFLAGLYGMNYEFMPLLHHPAGFYVMLACMVACAATMLLFFRRRRWV